MLSEKTTTMSIIAENRIGTTFYFMVKGINSSLTSKIHNYVYI